MMLAQERGESPKASSRPPGTGTELAFPQAQQPCLIKDATLLLTENKKVFLAAAPLPSVSARLGKVPKEWL